jgi:threonine aldolase
VIDLRSDTVTRPTPAMRRAMAEAEVGDDVYGEDPTVNRLESIAASIIGKERTLYVPSGTMGNQIAIAVHAERGSEVLCEARSHVIEHELASMAVISGCMPRPIPTTDGVLSADRIERMIRPAGPGLTRAGVIVVENTHNQASGAVTPPEPLGSIGDLAREHGIPLHMDGARIFNAAIACGRTAEEMTRAFDSVMFCLSKGLCAPVGSLLAGGVRFIEEARRWRKRLGGGMRQAGVLAAAGIVALETMRERLVEDHDKTRRLVEGLSGIPGLSLDVPDRLTNIVFVKVAGPRRHNHSIAERLKKRGVLVNAYGDERIRFVTHHDVSGDDIATALSALREVQDEHRADS